MESKTYVKCNICQKTFPEQIFSAHQSLHSEDKFHPCEMCKKSFTDITALAKHKQIHLGKYSCKICLKSFIQRGDLTKHKRTHIGEMPHFCKICQKSFEQKRYLTQHEKIHTGEKPYSCKICQKSFTQKSNFTIHNRIHTGDKPYSCKICQKSFPQKGYLTLHKRIHTGEKPYSCKICQRSYTKNSDLTIHKRIHTGQKPFSCEICQVFFTHSSILIQHKKSGAHLKRQESLNLVESMESTADIKCNICQKTFPEQIFTAHQILHSEDKLHPCNLCKKVFTHKDALFTHKCDPASSLICNLCDKTFPDKSSYRYHLRVHPYSCEICQVFYSHSSSLTQHKKTVAHLKRQKSLNIDHHSNLNNYVDCDETIKIEDIKEELDESVEDPLSVQLYSKTDNLDDYDYEKIDLDEFKLEDKQN